MDLFETLSTKIGETFVCLSSEATLMHVFSNNAFFADFGSLYYGLRTKYCLALASRVACLLLQLARCLYAQELLLLCAFRY